jgi:integrase
MAHAAFDIGHSAVEHVGKTLFAYPSAGCRASDDADFSAVISDDWEDGSDIGYLLDSFARPAAVRSGAAGREECHAVMRTPEGRERLILRIFLVSGLRSQELFLLRANDLESGQIRVDEAFKRAEHGEDRIGEPKTEGSADEVAIPADLESELRAWIQSKGQSGADLLFPSAVGGPIDPSNYLDRTLRPLGIKAGVPDINFAMLRRTCATYFRDNLKGAQQQLRDKTPHVTAKHYQQSITAEHRLAVAKLDQELCNPEKKVVSIKRRA